MKTQLKIRTEYSFRTAYGPVESVVEYLQLIGCTTAAITDRNSTFGHISWSKHCKARGIKPIFGVELGFTPDITSRERRQAIFYMSLLARSNAGLREIYGAVEESTRNFFRVPRLPIQRLQAFSQDVLILSGNTGLGAYRNLLPEKTLIEVHSATNRTLLNQNTYAVPVSDNYMITPENREVYEILTGRNAFNRPSPMHILTRDESIMNYPKADFALADALGQECDAAIYQATNIRVERKHSLIELCVDGANKRGLILKENYLSRLHHEIAMIEQKDFVDYFLVIADMVRYAKKHMLVGPARGSSCGSLVCYLMGITDIDPLVHGLIFERFIDVTRHDLPDIDIDFQDTKRHLVIDYLIETYGADKVAQLGTISRHKARSAIGTTAKALQIPLTESNQLADMILPRADGDERSDKSVYDTFVDTEAGKLFLNRFPNMMVASKLEGHANHSGKHAAGVILTNEPIISYVAKDARTGAVQIDKYDAEKINLMKIDLLGLRTLTIIADCLAMIELEYSALLAHPLDDDAAFEILRKRFFCGIFQFEGTALQNLTRTIKVDRFTDIVALTALARPGPLIAGSSYEWCARRTGRKPTELLHPMMSDITTETNGLIVFQEQMLRIIREIGMLSWEDTTALRKGMAKSMGLEYFERYWETFKDGALTNQIDGVLARRIWETVNSAGGYAFNKSHSVAYAMLSYWCCVLKSKAPLQFAIATLRNIGDADHIKAYLRELDRMGYEFKTFDAKLSQETWTIQEGKVIGGLMNIVGVGPKMAQTLIARRKQNLPATEAQAKRLQEGKTPFDNVFEARTKYADLLANPAKYGVLSKLWNISDLPDEPGTYAVMAKMTKIKIRSLNELRFLIERGGMRVSNDKWLTMTLEDDTDTIAATVARNDFQRLGMPLTKMKAGQWLIFRGNLLENNRRLYINKYKVL